MILPFLDGKKDGTADGKSGYEAYLETARREFIREMNRSGEFVVVDSKDLNLDLNTAKVADGKLYPLNGAVLGRKVKSDQGVMQLQREYWDGRMEVTHEGCLVRDYMDYGYPDEAGSLVGKQVFVNPKMPVSIEVTSQLRLAEEELFQFHRRHIVGIIQN